jgi:hypothetical protein
MPTEYWIAGQELLELAGRIVNEHHPLLVEHDVNIAFLMRKPTAKSGGRKVMGSASKASAKIQALTGQPIAFIIEISAEIWEDLPESKRSALLDHELCHCDVEVDDEGEVKYKLRSHDLEEFNEIVLRHGEWKDDIKDFHEQLSLFPAHLADRVLTASGFPEDATHVEDGQELLGAVRKANKAREALEEAHPGSTVTVTARKG